MGIKNKRGSSPRTESPDNDSPHDAGSDAPGVPNAGQVVAGAPAFEAVPATSTTVAAVIPATAPPSTTLTEFPGVQVASMLDPAALAQPPAPAGASPALDKMTLADLLALRGEIDKLLPPHTLAEMDLESELLLQYQLARELMTKALSSGAFNQINHQATTVNTCQAILAAVIKSQSDLHDSERVKAIELALERWFKARPFEEREKFFEAYAASMREIAGRGKTRPRRDMK